ncbi:hypothetical protein ASPZODRAFT_131722 [Penicilliopsis zonata CBS 506.65]|uniref:Isochorismatase-like domain-containing protein n=1 Tax=Penicilliopsis zonata CBS 506.65 TaxID=1073090 RepID=A0A1L9SIC3_9EURO|nr:hypothetical protein ASPZODRAFT_131722 [Penicilliopsis zonata CBS 506.65]OJJ46833.1 hypothetical protein ASPZODRAFT_131722 [Penicilliopsis zonata CBS 506.65]
MKFSSSSIYAFAALCLSQISAASSSNLTFGENYAVLNLDLISGAVAYVNTTTSGEKWINNTATWINTVHQQSPPPLSIFTRIYYANTKRPELGADTPYATAAAVLGNATATSAISEIYPAFVPLPNWDVVLEKARYYAGAGNSLEEILRAQKIDTVILSGISGAGVVLSTAYRLFDLDYRVIVISNNTIDLPPYGDALTDVICNELLPTLDIEVITVDEAIAALNRSGPAVY